jgi:hypothetical protein
VGQKQWIEQYLQMTLQQQAILQRCQLVGFLMLT